MPGEFGRSEDPHRQRMRFETRIPSEAGLHALPSQGAGFTFAWARPANCAERDFFRFGEGFRRKAYAHQGIAIGLADHLERPYRVQQDRNPMVSGQIRVVPLPVDVESNDPLEPSA